MGGRHPQPHHVGVCSLARALAYENDAVIHKFLERHALSFAEGRDLFRETRRWLWLVATLQAEAAASRGSAPPPLAIDGPLVLLDEMWHTFILFTRDYLDYCESRFGRWIHHAPTTHEAKERRRREFARDPGRALKAEEGRMRVQYQYVCNRLGERTLRKWYLEYAGRYRPDFVRAIQRLPGEDPLSGPTSARSGGIPGPRRRASPAAAASARWPWPRRPVPPRPA